MPRNLDTSTDVGTSTHFDDFFRVVAEEYFCGSRGFDRKFDDFDTIFEAWADISSQITQNTLPDRARSARSKLFRSKADEGAPIALTGELLYGTVYALRTYSHRVPLNGVRYTFTHAAAPAGQTHWETVEEEERELA